MGMATGHRRYVQAAAYGLVFFLGLYGVKALRTSPRPEASGDRHAGAPALDLGRPSDLPLPSHLSVAQFEGTLFEFLNTRQYVALGWLRDKGVRDTGPYIGGQSYGTHPAVRVYYSPGIVQWLLNGRVGPIPDGEMIVKEQFAAPAIRHLGKSDDDLWKSLESWTVMVKDSAGSHDGWFWSNPVKGQCVVDGHQYPFAHPVSGFGLYCVRCHAATQSPGAEPASAANEFTFASLRNIAGFPGEPLQFRVDDSWRQEAQKASAPAEASGESLGDAHPRCTRPRTPERAPRRADPRFLDFFRSIKPMELTAVAPLPPSTQDWVVSSRNPQREFVTANQCMSCHAGLVAPFGPSLFIPTEKSTAYGGRGWDVSPHGEWRWTPMGLAGRDPIFLAQLESELHLLRAEFHSGPAFAANLCAVVADTCLRCHGAMGKRQFELDHPGTPAKISLDHVQAVAHPADPPGHGASAYGALARDGVSCMVCHRMQPRAQPADDPRPALQYFLETSITGNFQLGKKGTIYGPYKDEEIAPYAMEHATGLKPAHGEFLKSSQLCGTCHTVALPAVGGPRESSSSRPSDELCRSEAVPLLQSFHHHVEQATYLEWLNSAYENEINKQNPRAQSCQDCHMERGLRDERHGIDLKQIRTRIAVIEDTTYPEAENLAARDQLHVRVRDEGFRRHNFSGLNLFLLELFNQFDDVLGVPRTDFMTGSKQGIEHAAEHFVHTARHDVASLEVQAETHGPHGLSAHVRVQNKAGHRFPSGVGFRRAFLELLVVETAADRTGSEKVLWASGRTNELGMLIGADGQPLPTEFFARDPRTGRQRYQEHHEVITSPDQVQVYETLRRNSKGEFTTSFLLGWEIVKDNRLLPQGWKPRGPGPALTGRFLEATYPDPATAVDPRYGDGSGSDEVVYRIELPGALNPDRLQVRATLYYQAVPPYYLRSLFETAPDDPATRRLYSLCSHVDLKGTPLEGWKLRITSATSPVKGPS